MITETDQLYFVSEGFKPSECNLMATENTNCCWKGTYSNRYYKGLFGVFFWKKKVMQVLKETMNLQNDV